jgi:hypothetical protein
VRSNNKYDLLTIQEVPETESSEKRLPEKKKEETRRTVKIRSVLVGQKRSPDAPASIKAIPGYQFALSVTLKQDNGKTVDAKALIDSGCDTSSVDRKWVAEKNLDTLPLPEVIKVQNADGSPNANGPSVNSLPGTLRIGEHMEEVNLMVTDLPKQYPIFLGLDWLNKHDPRIHWKSKRLIFNGCPEPNACFVHSAEIQDTEEPLPDYFSEFPEVFSKESFDKLPPRRSWDHTIEFTEDIKPFGGKIYSLTKEEQTELDKFLDENLKTGRIRLSKSPYASLFFFKHEEGKLWPIVDYRQLNKYTKKNRCVVPLIKDIINRFKSARYFTKMDVRWGFNNIQIKEGHEERAAFVTHRGLFEPTVMQFGLCNAPVTFQAFMNEIFREEVLAGEVQVYIDDMGIATMTREENCRITRKVLERLAENNLYLRPEKCEFERKEIKFLGMIISHNQIHPNLKKVKAIQDWPIPKSKKHVQQFLGLLNHFCRFIKDFAKLT